MRKSKALVANRHAIGQQIRAAREKQHLRQVDLAVAAKLYQPDLSRIELGKAAPNIHALIRLAAALGVSFVIDGDTVAIDT